MMRSEKTWQVETPEHLISNQWLFSPSLCQKAKDSSIHLPQIYVTLSLPIIVQELDPKERFLWN